MTLVIPQGFGEVTFVYSVVGITRPITWSIGVDNDTSLSASGVVAVASTAMKGNPMATAGNMGNKWTFVKTVATTNSLAGLITAEEAANVTGSSSAGRPPVNCAVLIRKNTNLGGRRFRGRIFHPVTFLDEAAIDEAGNIAGASIATVQGWFAQLFETMETAGLPFVLLHENPATAPTVINLLQVQGQLATQRRRMRG